MKIRKESIFTRCPNGKKWRREEAMVLRVANNTQPAKEFGQKDDQGDHMAEGAAKTSRNGAAFENVAISSLDCYSRVHFPLLARMQR